MFERFNDEARRIVVLAIQEAERRGSNAVGVEHIILGLIAEPFSAAGKLVAEIRISANMPLENLHQRIDQYIRDYPIHDDGVPRFTEQAKAVLNCAAQEATDLGEDVVGSEYILFGLYRESALARFEFGIGMDWEWIRWKLFPGLVSKPRDEETERLSDFSLIRPPDAGGPVMPSLIWAAPDIDHDGVVQPSHRTALRLPFPAPSMGGFTWFTGKARSNSVEVIHARCEDLKSKMEPYLGNSEVPPWQLCLDVWELIKDCTFCFERCGANTPETDVAALHRISFDLNYCFLYLQFKSNQRNHAYVAQSFGFLAANLEYLAGRQMVEKGRLDRALLSHIPLVIDFAIWCGKGTSCDTAGLPPITRGGMPSILGTAIETITGLEYMTDQLHRNKPPSELVSLIEDQVRRHYPRLRKFTKFGTTEKLSQRADVKNARRALTSHLGGTYFSATKSYCVSTAAAFASDRDLIYISSGQAHQGTAIRYSCKTGEVECLELRDLRYKTEEGLRQELATIFKAVRRRAISRGRLEERLNRVLVEVGEIVTGPILKAWPDSQRMAFVPVHGVLDLPLATAYIDSAPAIMQRDITITPNGRCLLLSALSKQLESSGNRIYVACDPSNGVNRIENVIPEAERVAAVYGTTARNLSASVTVETESAIRHVTRGATPRLRLYDRSTEVDMTGIVPAQDYLEGLCESETVHLACHGIITDDPIYESSLRLGGDVSMTHLLNRGVARGSVFVLSACSVGGIVPSYPSELLGFPASLISAGARNVLASTWPVPDSDEVADLMVDFHTNLTTGATSSDALRRAIGRSFASGVGPFHWAGFSMYGA